MQLTGIPDLQKAAHAAQRGEPLEALGQGAYGLANLAMLAAPTAKALQPAVRAVPSMLMDTTGAIKYARKFDGLADIKSDPNYVYHATSFDRLHDIAEEKKLSTFKPNYGTGQDTWPEEWRPLEADYNDLTKLQLDQTPIRAYHGSPYDFDAFDLSKIGTGEGAQAYGHGLYLAENPEVAASYKRPELYSDKIKPTVGGKEITPTNENEQYALNAVRHAYLTSTSNPNWSQLIQKWDSNPEVQKVLSNWVTEGIERNPGRIYEVNINADPETFLHWDKPLSEQPNVVKALEAMGIQEPPKIVSKGQTFGGWENEQGQDVLARLSSKLGGADKASEALRKAGISGIKYLDQGSRAGGEGTHNYVVFDPSMIDIVKKYGLAPLIAGGAYSISDNQHIIPVDHNPFEEDK